MSGWVLAHSSDFLLVRSYVCLISSSRCVCPVMLLTTNYYYLTGNYYFFTLEMHFLYLHLRPLIREYLQLFRLHVNLKSKKCKPLSKCVCVCASMCVCDENCFKGAQQDWHPPLSPHSFLLYRGKKKKSQFCRFSLAAGGGGGRCRVDQSYQADAECWSEHSSPGFINERLMAITHWDFWLINRWYEPSTNSELVWSCCFVSQLLCSCGWLFLFRRWVISSVHMTDGLFIQ